jgi:chromosome segregation ATPase
VNSILIRQISRTIGGVTTLPPKVIDLLNLVSQTYDNFDEDRTLTQRSLEISSRELSEKNKQLKEELAHLKTSGIKISLLEEAKLALKTKADELEKLNQIMIDRESRIIELKNKVKELERQLVAYRPPQNPD